MEMLEPLAGESPEETAQRTRDVATRKRRRLDTEEDRKFWLKLFSKQTGVAPSEIELKMSVHTGAILARVLMDDGTQKAFSNAPDIATENYFEALTRLEALPPRNRMPEGLAGATLNIIRSMCRKETAELKWEERGAPVAVIVQRVIDVQRISGKRDRRADLANRALVTLIRQGHIYYHPIKTATDYVRVTENDEEGFEENETSNTSQT